MTPEEQAQYPFRCGGAIRLAPILKTAFNEGVKGQQPVVNAARIESALLWYLYLSVYAEAVGAGQNAADVDASWGFYTGGESREKPRALAQYIQERSQEAHDRVWDGLLAVRCWRDLDDPSGPAMNLELQKRALAQLDRALLRGLAVIVRQRAEVLPCEPAWASVEILGGALLREAEARDPAQATIFFDEISRRRAVLVDKDKLVASIDALFPCP